MTGRVLITKLSTSNLGNEVLSNEMIRLARPHGFAVVGRPADLHRYCIGRLPLSPESALTTFHGWAGALTKVLEVATKFPAVANATAPRVTIQDESAVRASRFRQWLSRAGRIALSGFPVGPRYLARARLLGAANVVVYSGAGEVGDYDPFLRQALELEALLRAGKSVFAVNQSIVVTDPRLRRIVSSVYGRLSGIVVRGERSRNLLHELGVRPELIRVAPDTAWRARVKTAERRGSEGVGHSLRIGITVNGLGSVVEDWIPVLRELNRQGHQLVFLTSDAGYDAEAGRLLARHVSMVIPPQADSADAYCGQLAAVDLVVTERLHTAVLALIQGARVVCVERGVHKTQEVFDVFGSGVPVIVREGHWQAKVLVAVKEVIALTGGSLKQIATRVEEMAELAAENLPPEAIRKAL